MFVVPTPMTTQIAVIDTLWYDQWVLPNLDYSYLEPQIGEYY